MSTTRTMSPEAAVAALGMLALRYSPRPMPWTDTQAQPSVREATMLAWVDVLTKYPDAAVLAALEAVCTTRPEWAPNLNEMHNEVLAQARRLSQADAQARALQSRYRCDGTGWLDPDGTGDNLTPCPTCNPWLRDEWREGRFGDHGGQRADRLKAWQAEHAMPPTCAQPPGEMAAVPAVGLAFAWAAYHDACVAEGRNPDPAVFGPWAAGLA